MKLDTNAVDDNDFPVYPEGDYEFEVENTTYQQNKNKTGYQWKVQFRIDAEGGKTFKVWEYFIENENNQWKFNQFFKSIGMYDVDDTMEMKNVVGEIGRCHVVISPPNNGYPEKNSIKKFYPMPAEKKEVKIDSEDLPF